MRTLLLVAALALAPAATAQGSAPVEPDGQDSAVGFSLRASVPTTNAPVPAVITALAGDGHLARLDLSRGSHTSPREEIRAEFVFRSVADYVAWRESDRVVALLAELEAVSQGAGVATAFSLRRYPLVALVPDGD